MRYSLGQFQMGSVIYCVEAVDDGQGAPILVITLRRPGNSKDDPLPVGHRSAADAGPEEVGGGEGPMTARKKEKMA